MENNKYQDLLKEIAWNEQGLVPVIAQEYGSGDVLMMAWMNEAAFIKTLEIGQAVYWSRSRNKLWHKGEESGHFQIIKSIHLDCDGDTLLIKVEQIDGIACHTGAHSCFFRDLDNQASSLRWQK
ncbi:phosphoribosyl-AMP cyclohydrolase [Polynucleobacter sp. MWH-Loch1C5]|uniref:phosphoribosyl-AMP cyclohydrolase n=1 Tax=Polynucleobacter sp. MWH-Loch1C5 TaxID=2689108 RepID=UPI001C0B03C6|nr:phosphoribosyl-AMP cyclohydrolase [Polynucleobacter sp. MWH-Loch1C5]MBU3542356.1 phosphoribosyl-AMP cyclohydrolase [Polynucleobacter sp. MWH-Loch1C5]